jgi:outer membrane immunogenic protein
MNFRRSSIFAAGLLFSASTGAMAADVEVTPDLWSGFYLGAQAGYMQGTGSDSDLCFSDTGVGSGCFSDADDGFDISDNNMDGVTVGGYVGYNYRIDQVVLGLEGDANWDNANGSSSVLGSLNYDTGINWDFSVRARLGLVVDERALLYVTGGPSWVNTDVDTNLGIGVADVANFKSGDESTEFGWVLGAGAEYAITEHLSMKAEYLHGWYGDADLDLFEFSDGVDNTKYVLKQNLQTNVVRVGLAYHFGGF